MIQKLRKLFGVSDHTPAQPEQQPEQHAQTPMQYKQLHGHYPDIKHVRGGCGEVTIHAPARPKIRADVGPGFDWDAHGIEYLNNRDAQLADDGPAFDWDAFSQKCDQIAAEAIVREQNKPWEPDGEYEYPSE